MRKILPMLLTLAAAPAFAQHSNAISQQPAALPLSGSELILIDQMTAGKWVTKQTPISTVFTSLTLNPQNNLADLANIPIARANLGLGTAALQNIGTAGANVPLLSTTNTWSGAQTFANMPNFLAGQLPPANGGTGLATFARSGSTTTFATATGTLVNGHCVSIDASGNFIDAGGTCTVGGGGGTVTAATAGQIAIYPSSGTSVAGATTGTGVLTALSNTAGAAGGFATYNQLGAATTFQNPASGSVSRTTTSKLSDFVNIDDFGGSRSTATATCSTTAGSAVMTCTAANDFANGAGLRINHAGPASGLGNPATVTVTPCGTNPFGNCVSTGGGARYYSVVALDGQGGYGAAYTTYTPSTPVLSIQNFEALSWPAPSSGPVPAAYAIYGGPTIGGQVLLDYVFGTTWNDYGHSARQAEDWLPTTPPAAAGADWLITTVTSGGTTTAITLLIAASQTVSGTTITHDNSPNFAAAFAASNMVWVNCGAAYPISGAGIRLGAGQTLAGYSKYCASLVLTTGLIKSAVVQSNSVAGPKVLNLGINGGGFWEAGDGMVACGLCTNAVYQDLALTNFGKYGIVFNGGSNARILNNDITIAAPLQEINEAILVSNSAGTASNFMIENNRAYGVGFDLAILGASIVNNTIIGFGFGGGVTTEQSPTSGNYIIALNVISSGYTTVDVNDTCPVGIENWGAYSVISGNRVTYNCGSGVTNGGQYTSVSGNIAVNNGGTGYVTQMGSASYNGFGSAYVGNTAAYTGGAIVQNYGYAEATGAGGSSYATLGPNAFANNHIGATGPLSSVVFQKSPTVKASQPYSISGVVNGGVGAADITVVGSVVGATCSVTYSSHVYGLTYATIAKTNAVSIYVTNNSGSTVTNAGTATVTCELPSAY